MQISSFYSKKRIITVFIILILLLIYILVSYAFLASKKVPVFIKPVENIERGSILDRNGKSLAVQTNFYHLCASPAAISDKEKTANILAKPLEYTPEHLLSLLDSTASFVYIKKKMDQTEYNEVSKIIEKNKIYGFRFEKVQGRTYPENALASQVIGFMGNDGTGLSGI